jgi:hypothetical protein
MSAKPLAPSEYLEMLREKTLLLAVWPREYVICPPQEFAQFIYKRRSAAENL